MSSREFAPELFRRVAVDPQQTFGLSRDERSGTPTLWRELLVYRRGGFESYCTTRSVVDDGGEPIGQWVQSATPHLGEELLAAFEKSELWRLSPEAISPGQNAVTWSYNIGSASGEVTLRADSPAMFSLREVDTLMRRVSHWLLEAGVGACLRCHVLHHSGSDRVGMAISNPGSVDALVPNPMLGAWGKQHFLRFELAAPVEDPDPTGLGPVYRPISTFRLNVSDPAWQLPMLRLPAGGRKFVLPVESRFIDAPVPSSMLRGVFSNYIQPIVQPPDSRIASHWPDLSTPLDAHTLRPRAAVVFGRAFSDEVIL